MTLSSNCFRPVFKLWKLKLKSLLISNLFFFHIPGCGDTLTSPSGTITSPGHPSSYPHGANCTWYINVSPGNLIRLTFVSFNLEYHANCNFDYLEVYDNGTVQTGKKIGRYTWTPCTHNCTYMNSTTTLHQHLYTSVHVDFIMIIMMIVWFTQLHIYTEEE